MPPRLPWRAGRRAGWPVQPAPHTVGPQTGSECAAPPRGDADGAWVEPTSECGVARCSYGFRGEERPCRNDARRPRGRSSRSHAFADLDGEPQAQLLEDRRETGELRIALVGQHPVHGDSIQLRTLGHIRHAVRLSDIAQR